MTTTATSSVAEAIQRTPRRRTARRLISMAAAALALTSICLTGGSPASASTASANSAVSRAHSYGANRGVSTAVAVLDLRTGHFYGAGRYSGYYGSASVMKLFVADKLLATGQMYGSNARYAYSMITRSDDNALQHLLPKVGGTSVVNWVGRRYGIHIGAPTPVSWCWGRTQISAKGIVYFYAHMMKDNRVRPWLLNALNHRTKYAADGTNQNFGIPSATSPASVKQGWGHCSSNTGGSVINTTGIVNGGRYAVAILTNTNYGYINGNAYNSWQAGVVSRVARTLLPYGRFPA